MIAAAMPFSAGIQELAVIVCEQRYTRYPPPPAHRSRLAHDECFINVSHSGAYESKRRGGGEGSLSSTMGIFVRTVIFTTTLFTRKPFTFYLHQHCQT